MIDSYYTSRSDRMLAEGDARLLRRGTGDELSCQGLALVAFSALERCREIQQSCMTCCLCLIGDHVSFDHGCSVPRAQGESLIPPLLP